MNTRRIWEARRQFLRRSMALGIGGVAPYFQQLQAIAAAADTCPILPPGHPPSGQNTLCATNPNYKALVCLFMYGGNDNANFLIPFDAADYTKYATDRTNLMIPKTGTPSDPTVNLRGLIPIGPLANQGNKTLGFHPNVGVKAGAATAALFRADGLPWLWDNGRLALVANCGPLVVPMTKLDYTSKSKPRPQNLYSHSDQQVTWMTSTPAGYSPTGVGGRIADIVDPLNIPPPGTPKVATCISIAGVNTYQAADTATPYQINSSGPAGLQVPYVNGYANSSAISSSISAAVNEQFARARTNYFETQWGAMMTYSLQTKAAIDAALALNPLPAAATFRTSGNSLSSQLRMVAKLINASTDLGMLKQIFFVQIGGFDVHGTEFHAQNNSNWNKISEAVYDFYNALAQIHGETQVTLFSASDFGRTYDSNGDGSDHGWGAHHFVVGGAVNGGTMYGTWPAVGLNTNDEVGRGSLLPTTSTDQYHATLAKWFGLTDAQVQAVLPNYLAFSPNYLGFL